MQCSDCSKRVRPVVVSDIDGTLAQYHETITMFSAMYFDHEVPDEHYHGDVPFRDYLGLTQAEHRAMKLAYRQGGNKRFVPAYQGAADLINHLRILGAEIWVATTRPYERLDNIDPDTKEWLRRNDILVDGLLYGDDKYNQLVETVDPERIVVCFEDLVEQIEIGELLGLPMFHVYRPHNYSMRWFGGDLRLAYTFARDRIAMWEGRNG